MKNKTTIVFVKSALHKLDVNTKGVVNESIPTSR